MQKIYPKLLETDVIVVGCPNYFKNVSALTKNFIDRTNAFVRVKPRKLEGKYAIGLCVGGEELEDTQHCADALIRFFKAHRMRILLMVKAKADELGSISNNTELGKKLVEIGKKIAKNEIDVMTSTTDIVNEKYSIAFFGKAI
jgi:multimeric flavodoxin WrbA